MSSSIFGQVVNYEKIDTVIIKKKYTPKYNDSIYIIHLTDIHLNIKDCETSNKFEEYCDTIRQRYDASNTYIIITGDFAKSNNECLIINEFKLAKCIIDTKLNGFEVLVCPGNHDFSKDVRGFSDVKVNAFNTIFYGGEMKYPNDTVFDNNNNFRPQKVGL